MTIRHREDIMKFTNQKEVIVKRLKDGAYLTIPERDLYSTLKQGFEFVAYEIDTMAEMQKLFGKND